MPVEEFSYPSGAPLSDHPPVAVELSWDAAD
jgi:hypothetical protein